MRFISALLVAAAAVTGAYFSMSEATSAASLTASPVQGKAPLKVTFSGGSGGKVYFGGIMIDFGDGEQSLLCDPGRSCKDKAISHTYAKAGTYRVRLYGRGEGENSSLARVTITVN
ncbi:MAG: PKD domain-containing protein [Hyphomicrobiaceae bacterium]